MNLDYLNLLHDAQTEAIRIGLEGNDLNIDPQKIKQKISEQMTEDLIGKISIKNNKSRVKVTYEVECDSISGEITYGNLIDIVDVIAIEKTSSNVNSKSIIDEFIQAGNQLKKQQIEVLTKNNFEILAQQYKNDPVSVKRKIKRMPTIGRVAYKALADFLSFNYS